MNSDDFRKSLDSRNRRNQDVLNHEAYLARADLIDQAKSYILDALAHDLEAINDLQGDNILYMLVHERHEETGVDAFGNKTTVSIKMVGLAITVQGMVVSELYIHLPISDDAYKAFLESESDTSDAFFDAVKNSEPEAINVHIIENHGDAETKSTIKHITPFGSIDYHALSRGSIDEHLVEFEYFIEQLPDFSNVDEIIAGTDPEKEMQFSKPADRSDINFINDLRDALIKMTIVPQKKLTRPNKTA